ncbi:MAG: hypothetical protein Q8L64_03065 [bacterium]|nr:hypothetical protein [bacterium]
MPKNTNNQSKRTHMAGAYIKTYVYFFNVAGTSIKDAEVEKKEEIVFYKCMTSIVFLAFCIEAYLNHMGEDELQHWKDDFESLRPIAKLRLLMSKYGELDFSRRPFQSFSDIFDVRNQLAHGKTVFAFEKYPKEPLAKWGKLCNVKNVKKLFDDTEKMIRFIHTKITNNTEVDPFSPGFKFFGFVQE